ncbi:predicted protein, partial [Naegleria gruberi]
PFGPVDQGFSAFNVGSASTQSANPFFPTEINSSTNNFPNNFGQFNTNQVPQPSFGGFTFGAFSPPTCGGLVQQQSNQIGGCNFLPPPPTQSVQNGFSLGSEFSQLPKATSGFSFGSTSELEQQQKLQEELLKTFLRQQQGEYMTNMFNEMRGNSCNLSNSDPFSFGSTNQVPLSPQAQTAAFSFDIPNSLENVETDSQLENIETEKANIEIESSPPKKNFFNSLDGMDILSIVLSIALVFFAIFVFYS